MADRDKQIRERAYSIWQSEGAHEGHHEDHWHRAQAELQNDAAAMSQSIPDRDTINEEPTASQDGVDAQSRPPVGSGQSQGVNQPVESGDETNPKP